jgi:hypothetical protein
MCLATLVLADDRRRSEDPHHVVYDHRDRSGKATRHIDRLIGCAEHNEALHRAHNIFDV